MNQYDDTESEIIEKPANPTPPPAVVVDWSGVKTLHVPATILSTWFAGAVDMGAILALFVNDFSIISKIIVAAFIGLATAAPFFAIRLSENQITTKFSKDLKRAIRPLELQIEEKDEQIAQLAHANELANREIKNKTNAYNDTIDNYKDQLREATDEIAELKKSLAEYTPPPLEPGEKPKAIDALRQLDTEIGLENMLMYSAKQKYKLTIPEMLKYVANRKNLETAPEGEERELEYDSRKILRTLKTKENLTPISGEDIVVFFTRPSTPEETEKYIEKYKEFDIESDKSYKKYQAEEAEKKRLADLGKVYEEQMKKSQ